MRMWVRVNGQDRVVDVADPRDMDYYRQDIARANVLLQVVSTGRDRDALFGAIVEMTEPLDLQEPTDLDRLGLGAV